MESVHEKRSGIVTDAPHAADHVLRASLQEVSGEAGDLVSPGHPAPVGRASAEDDEAGFQVEVHHFI